MKSVRIITCALALALPGAAYAGGFQINEHAAGATGMAGSVFATVDDATGVFYNPAGITGTKGSSFVAGVSFIVPSGEYTGVGLPSTNPGGQEVTQSVIVGAVPVPHAYMSHQLSDKAFVGFGFYAPYGLGLEWDNSEEWVGRTVIKDLSLRTFFFTPTVALKLSDMVSVAVSVSLVPATVSLTRTLGAVDNGQVLFPSDGTDGEVEFGGTAFGVGANAGIQVTLIEHLKLGFAYRSAVGLDFDGNADFRLPAGTPPDIAATFPDGTGSGEITLPHSFALGIGWVQDALKVELSGNLTLWNSYDELRINFDSGLPTPASISPRDYNVVPTFRLGGEYTFLGRYALRLGLAYDITPAPDTTVDPTLPDQSRFIFTAGLGATASWFGIDVGYMGLLLPEREITADNINFGQAGEKYNSRMIHVIGTTLSFTHDFAGGGSDEPNEMAAPEEAPAPEAAPEEAPAPEAAPEEAPAPEEATAPGTAEG